MNFLSHYFFDQHSSDPYYILGIALPDLSKSHNRRWNIHPAKNEDVLSKSPEIQSIYKGWKKHLSVDELFHEAPFFKHYSHIITEKMREIPFENKLVKPFMIGHVGLELILDTLLIKNKKLDPTKFYDSLNACELSPIMEFLKLNGIENPESFKEFYAKFLEYRYLLSYQNNESIVYALNRIQYRLTRNYLSENDVLLMNKSFEDLMHVIEMDYLSIFEQIESTLLNEKNL